MATKTLCEVSDDSTGVMCTCPACKARRAELARMRQVQEAAEERALAGPAWTYGELCRIDYEGPGAFCQCARCTAEAHAKEERFDEMELLRSQREPSAAELEAERKWEADEYLALCSTMLEGFFYR